MKTFSIYALKEPDTGEIRYFGKTCQVVQKRFNSHRKCKQETHVARWVRTLASAGKLPLMEVLITGLTNEESIDEEKNLVAWGRSKNLRLTNLTDGGDGRLGFVPSEETRKKIALGLVGNKNSVGSTGLVGYKQPPERVEKTRIRMLGNKHSVGHKNAAGHSYTPSEGHRKAVGDFHRGKKHTPERRAATSLRMLGNKNGLGNKSSLGRKHSAEQNERQSARMMGNKFSLGHKNSLGFKHSVEQNERQSATMIAVWKKKKQLT